MKYILAICAVFIFTSYAMSKEPYIIRYDMGGKNIVYFNKFKQLVKEKRLIIIDGKCASACTLVIHKEVGANVCITPRAQMGFHKPFRISSGFIKKSAQERTKVDRVWDLILSGYPPAIRRIVKNAPDPKRGARITDVLWLGYKDLRKSLKTC